MKQIAIAAALAATLALPAPALAQEEKEDVRVRIGLGAQVRPEYVGAKDRDVGPLFDVDIARGDDVFRIEAPDDSFGLRLIREGRFTAGPVAAIVGGRKDSDVGAPVGRVKTTLEVGGFAEYLVADSFRLRGELRRGVNGHEGLIGSIGADQIWRDGDNYAVTLGPRLLFSDARYQRAWFGISPAAALATGLTAYRPGSGVHAVALAGGLTTQFGPRWGVFGYARGERLVGDAGKSPLVRSLGSRNQVSAGLGISYVFRVKR